MNKQFNNIMISLFLLFFGVYFNRAYGNAIPAAPEFNVKSYILMDVNSGMVIAEKNSNARTAPASLTKIMTLYLTADALRNEKIHLHDSVVISEKAWRTGGSKMFIKVGSSVSIQDLIKGVTVASGNDATIAIAEYLAGSESAFVDMMNEVAHDLNMNDTNFGDCSGFSNEINYSTAYDLAILSKAWLMRFPEYYSWFKDKWIIYNNIKQPNRNRLLWLDPSVDGIKTGYTEKAGYCLISSAERNNVRLLVVVLGAPNDNVRVNCSLTLLNYGFRYFDSLKIFSANTKINTAKTLFGKKNTIDLGLKEDLYVTLPKGETHSTKLKVKINIKKYYQAPIIKNQICGTLNVLFNNKIIMTKPLISLKNNDRTNSVFVVFDYIKLWLQSKR
ncbi:MAG: D-alanyl-D-alanine carboxypeptidase [Coxiellaceae bacterium]|jgi:D-alanyl-D-alanine carboxypeptidase (penicillin-binding protein 5/6)|nr:D-alanyl-D-alanine carboxypeptidase [Coxiellaceae bacterium]